MLIEQIIDFELRGPGPLGRTCTPKTGYFDDKTKISKAKRSSSESLFTAKNIAGGNVPQRWKPVGSTGRSGCRSGRDSSTGRSSRLKNWSNSPFWQLKGI